MQKIVSGSGSLSFQLSRRYSRTLPLLFFPFLFPRSYLAQPSRNPLPKISLFRCSLPYKLSGFQIFAVSSATKLSSLSLDFPFVFNFLNLQPPPEALPVTSCVGPLSQNSHSFFDEPNLFPQLSLNPLLAPPRSLPFGPLPSLPQIPFSRLFSLMIFWFLFTADLSLSSL